MTDNTTYVHFNTALAAHKTIISSANHVCLQQQATLNKQRAKICKQKEKIIKQQANKTGNRNEQLAWRRGTP